MVVRYAIIGGAKHRGCWRVLAVSGSGKPQQKLDIQKTNNMYHGSVYLNLSGNFGLTTSLILISTYKTILSL